MTNTANEIWEGDKLERKAEAIMLQRFLNDETDAFIRQRRDQAFVLALDAPYGEGKSWFLSRFREHLGLNHPVAFVDAWVDDANNEPLVSIMAALEDTLKPFLKKKAVKDRFGAMTRAAFPIMGKAVIGAAGSAISRYLGEEFGDTAKNALDAAAKKGGKDDEEPLDAGMDALLQGVSEVVDNAGRALLDQYRSRQRSREVFKESLRALASSINASDGSNQAPIFVIVDELDRCRPAYAIALLEEIKHLFDVPGIVFVIALHGQQLVHSINAVYGAAFDSQAYLRRFFNRTYALRRLSIKELVVSHFDDILPLEASFSAPAVERGNRFVELPAPELTGELLSAWGASPREAQAVLDCFRIFAQDWKNAEPIELPLLVVLLLNLIRGSGLQPHLPLVVQPEVQFAVRGGDGLRTSKSVPASQFFGGYSRAMIEDLPHLVRDLNVHGPEGYIKQQMQGEFARLHGNSHNPNQPPRSLWSTYPDRLKWIGRLMDQNATETETDNQ